MIKVCHMTSVHPSNDVRIFYKMCVSLANSGYDTYLVAPGESREEKGVHIVGVGAKPASRIKRMAVMTRRVYKKALELDAELYHFHDPELLPYGLKLKRKGKTVVFDCHEFYTLQIMEKEWIYAPLRKLIANIYRSYEAYACKRVDAVVAICSTLDEMDYFQNIVRCITYIINAPLLSEFCGSTDTEKGFQERAICYIVAISYARGITQLVLAAEKAKVVLKLAGRFSYESYEDDLTKMPEWDNVDYLGILNREEVAECIRSSAIGACVLLPKGQHNRDEGLPVKVYEYMACGLPIIINRHKYTEEFMNEYKCGICVNPEDIDEIASAVTYLVDNPDTAKKMGENGRRAILERFNWGIEEKKLCSLYEGLLGRNDNDLRNRGAVS